MPVWAVLPRSEFFYSSFLAMPHFYVVLHSNQTHTKKKQWNFSFIPEATYFIINQHSFTKRFGLYLTLARNPNWPAERTTQKWKTKQHRWWRIKWFKIVELSLFTAQLYEANKSIHKWRNWLLCNKGSWTMIIYEANKSFFWTILPPFYIRKTNVS